MGTRAPRTQYRHAAQRYDPLTARRPEARYRLELKFPNRLSVNGGRTEHLTGQAPVAGDVAGFAVPPSRATVVAIAIAIVTPGLSYLCRSANDGKTWAEIAVSSLTGEVSFTSLSYVSPTAG